MTPIHTSQRMSTDSIVSKGVDSYEVSLEDQTAKVVTNTVPYQTVLEKIVKTGKKVNSGKADGVDQPVTL